MPNRFVRGPFAFPRQWHAQQSLALIDRDMHRCWPLQMLHAAPEFLIRQRLCLPAGQYGVGFTGRTNWKVATRVDVGEKRGGGVAAVMKTVPADRADSHDLVGCRLMRTGYLRQQGQVEERCG